jgi:hypothetical protein
MLAWLVAQPACRKQQQQQQQHCVSCYRFSLLRRECFRCYCCCCCQAKVHQRALMAAGLVAGPDDPRLPTLAGLMRAGCHPDALRAFLLEQVC